MYVILVYVYVFLIRYDATLLFSQADSERGGWGPSNTNNTTNQDPNVRQELDREEDDVEQEEDDEEKKSPMRDGEEGLLSTPQRGMELRKMSGGDGGGGDGRGGRGDRRERPSSSPMDALFRQSSFNKRRPKSNTRGAFGLSLTDIGGGYSHKLDMDTFRVRLMNLCIVLDLDLEMDLDLNCVFGVWGVEDVKICSQES